MGIFSSSSAGYSAGLPASYTGPYYGGQIPYQDPLGNVNTADGSYDYTQFDAIRNQYFVPTGLAQLCHFAVIAHTLGGTLSTGSSRGFGSNDFVIALGTEPNGVGNEIQQAGTVMHELGHNLGLHHGGAVPQGTTPLPDIDANYIASIWIWLI